MIPSTGIIAPFDGYRRGPMKDQALPWRGRVPGAGGKRG